MTNPQEKKSIKQLILSILGVTTLKRCPINNKKTDHIRRTIVSYLMKKTGGKLHLESVAYAALFDWPKPSRLGSQLSSSSIIDCFACSPCCGAAGIDTLIVHRHFGFWNRSNIICSHGELDNQGAPSASGTGASSLRAASSRYSIQVSSHHPLHSQF